MSSGQLKDHVASLRRFNRFYTRHVGALEEGLLGTRFTLTQARVLYELGARGRATATEVGETLELDPGYLSRILRDFSSQRLITRTRAIEDGRRVQLALSAKGRRAFDDLDVRSHDRIAGMLTTLDKQHRRRLMAAIADVEQVLSDPSQRPRGAVVIRAPRVGDIGWAIEAHGRLYAAEYDWNAEFEALVATLFAGFASRHDPERERMWVAEVDGERAGCVFVVRNEQDPHAAQLRCLLVEPFARGHGIGRRLVDECITFARDAGYRTMVLWTNDVLVSARRIYEAAGFRLRDEESHHSFGKDLVGQVWELNLHR